MAQPCKLEQLARRAINVGSSIEYNHWLCNCWKNSCDCWAIEPWVQLEDNCRYSHLRTGISCGDKCVGITSNLHLEPNHHRALRLTNSGTWLLRHLDYVGSLDYLNTATLACQM